MDLNKLIAEVARRHQTLLGRGDPILVSATINELMLEEHYHRIQQALEQSRRTMAAATVDQVDAARSAASQMLVEGAKAAELVRACHSLRAQINELTLVAVQAAHMAGEREREARHAAFAAFGAALLAAMTLAFHLLRVR